MLLPDHGGRGERRVPSWGYGDLARDMGRDMERDMRKSVYTADIGDLLRATVHMK